MVAMLVGTVGAMTAALVGRAFALTDVLAALPSGIATLVAGATGGFIVGVSSVGRHLALAYAPLEHELAGMADDSELGRLLGRAASAYRDAVKAIGGEAPAARAAADELVGKMTRFGRRWRELELEAARVNPADLKERLQLVGARLESTNDPLARAELARAREAVAVQLAYVEEIARGTRARAGPARAPGGDARAAALGGAARALGRRRAPRRRARAGRRGADPGRRRLRHRRRGAQPKRTVAGALPAAARN